MNTEKQTKTLRFSRDLIKKAEAKAKAEKRSFNNWLEMLIEREVEKANLTLSEKEEKVIDEDIAAWERGELETYTEEEFFKHFEEKKAVNV